MRDGREVVGRLVDVADAMVDPISPQISDAAIRNLKEEIRQGRMQMSETVYVVDYEATCLIECIAELAYARSAGDATREERARMYINVLRTFVRQDLIAAARRAGS